MDFNHLTKSDHEQIIDVFKRFKAYQFYYPVNMRKCPHCGEYLVSGYCCWNCGIDLTQYKK